MSYLGLDIGTSGCKAVVFDVDGQSLGSAHESYAVLTPRPDWAELDSQGVIDACRRVVAGAAAEACHDPVRAMGISSQGEAFTPVGRDGRHLGKAMVSSDMRSLACMTAFVAAFGQARLYRITGHTPSPLFSTFKLLWLRQHAPAVWQAASGFYCFEDLVHHHMGIQPSMGWPLAGRTMLFDVTRHAWSPEILEALALDPGRLAHPVASGTVVGELDARAARAWGLPTGVRVVAGGHDQTIAALGAGVTEPGTAMYAAGSVDCICPVLPSLILDESLCRYNFCSYDYSLPGLRASVAYSLTGSNLLAYFREQFGGGRAYAELIGEMPEAPTSLLALPYFTPSGTPYFDPTTAGAVYGWRLTTSRGELLKGLLEGVALEIRLNLDLLGQAGVRIDRLIATGGGVRDRRLVQLKADVLDKPIERIEVEEAGCLGAARLAQGADMGVAVTSLVQRKPVDVVTPDPGRTAVYATRMARYCDLYARIKEFGDRGRSAEYLTDKER